MATKLKKQDALYRKSKVWRPDDLKAMRLESKVGYIPYIVTGVGKPAESSESSQYSTFSHINTHKQRIVSEASAATLPIPHDDATYSHKKSREVAFFKISLTVWP